MRTVIFVYIFGILSLSCGVLPEESVELRSGENPLSGNGAEPSQLNLPPPSPTFGRFVFRVGDEVYPETVTGEVAGFENLVKVRALQDGFFIVDPVPPGAQDLVVYGLARGEDGLADSDHEVGLFLPGVSSRAGESLDLQTLKLGALGEVAGRVLLSGARSHQDVTVSLKGVGKQVRTDAEGRFQIKGVPVGVHQILAEKSGFGRGRVHNVVLEPSGRQMSPELSLLRRSPGEVFASFHVSDFVVNTPRVEVVLGAPEDAALMMVSETESFFGKRFRPLVTTFEHEFVTEGEKQLFIRLADLSGQPLETLQTRKLEFRRYVVDGRPFRLVDENAPAEWPEVQVQVDAPIDAVQMRVWDTEGELGEWQPLVSPLRVPLVPSFGDHLLHAQLQNAEGHVSRTFELTVSANPVEWALDMPTGTCEPESPCSKVSLLGSAATAQGAYGLLSRSRPVLFRADDVDERLRELGSPHNAEPCLHNSAERPLFAAEESGLLGVSCLHSGDGSRVSGLSLFVRDSDLEPKLHRHWEVALEAESLSLHQMGVSSSGRFALALEVFQEIDSPFVAGQRLSPGTHVFFFDAQGRHKWHLRFGSGEVVRLGFLNSGSGENLLALLAESDEAAGTAANGNAEVRLKAVVLTESGDVFWEKKAGWIPKGLSQLAHVEWNSGLKGTAAGFSFEVSSLRREEKGFVLRTDRFSTESHVVDSLVLSFDGLLDDVMALKRKGGSFYLRSPSHLMRLDATGRLVWSHGIGRSDTHWVGEGSTTHSVEVVLPHTLFSFQNSADRVSVVKLRSW